MCNCIDALAKRQAFTLTSTLMAASTTTSQLLLGDDHLVADFPYDPDQVREIKQIDGAKWDKAARVWRVPMTSIDEIRRFAQRHDFWIEPDVLRFNLAIPKTDSVARIDGRHIAIAFPFDPVKVEAIKRFIPGAFFDTKTKRWKAPFASSGEVLEWAVKFGVVVEPDVLVLHRQQQESTTELLDASRAVDGHVEIPTLAGTLRPYQHAGISYALATRRCFIADDMGTGKTLMSLATLEAADAWPAVVVCPATLTLNWEAECNRWLPHRTVSVVKGRKEFVEPADLIVVGWANLSTWEQQLKGARGYVFDESHYAKTHTAQRTKSAVKIAKSAPVDGVVLCLSGTPITNRPAEYASQLEILGRLTDFGGRIAFWTRYCGAFKDRWGQWHTDGATHMEELNDRLRASCFTGDTLVLTDIGYTPIRELVEQRHDGHALGWSPDFGWQWGQIVGWSQRPASELVTVHLADGQRFTCTPEHLIHVEGRGWIAAALLDEGSVVCQLPTSGGDLDHCAVSGVLVGGAQGEEGQGLRDVSGGVHRTQPASAVLREDLRPQERTDHTLLSVVQSGLRNDTSGTGVLLQEMLQYSAVSPRWARSVPVGGGTQQPRPEAHRHAAQSPKAIGPDFSPSSTPEEDAGVDGRANGVADLLRGELLVRGSRRSDQPLGDRSGWVQPSAPRPALDGPAQGVPTRPCRVERVEVHQRPSGSRAGTSDRPDPDVVSVYDIEVDGVHSFVANSVLAHNCYIRRTKKQVLKDLPPMLENRILVPGNDKVMREYAKAEADIARYLAERAAEIAREIGANPRSAAVMARMKAESAEHLVRMSVLRRLAALAKMEAVTEWVESLLAGGHKVVLAAHHRDVVDELAARFGGLKIQGGQDIGEVEAHKSRFQTDPDAQVITLSIQAAKTGHTLTAAQDIGFVELPFTPADVDQTAARLHRIGQEGVVTSHFLLTANTIDTYVWELIQSKRAVVNAATDGGEFVAGDTLGAALTAHYTQIGLGL
jgi:hypothetical protein